MKNMRQKFTLKVKVNNNSDFLWCYALKCRMCLNTHTGQAEKYA